jgi:hypothetical protein
MYARGLDGERLVALVLNELGSDWHVFHGLKLWQDQISTTCLSDHAATCTSRPRTGVAW